MSAKAGLVHITYVVLNAHSDVVRFDIPYIVFADGDLSTPTPHLYRHPHFQRVNHAKDRGGILSLLSHTQHGFMQSSFEMRDFHFYLLHLQ